MSDLLRPDRSAAVAAELVALQRAAYAVEAELIGSTAIPPLHDTAESLVGAGLTWFGTRERLVVAPRAFRRGIGAALVRHVLGFAGARPVVVSTGRANVPARALYERLGFVRTADEEVRPGLWVTRYRHRPVTPAGPARDGRRPAGP
jgi:ribosomal protein S18 acetylase RimI-like enzyme